MSQDATAPARPAPETMLGVIPYLNLDGRAAEAADFYARAFGATDLGRVPDAQDPKIQMHVQIEINGRALMMTDCRAPWETGRAAPQGFHLQLVVPDADFWWTRAVEAGCTVVMPLERMFWGDRFGMLKDPFGFDWAVNEPAGI